MEVVQIFPPGASQLASAWASTIQLGSWIMADPGPDYGAKGLIESVQAQNALRDGGTFAYRRGVIRKMAIPLMINTPSPVMWESSLRKAVTPGAIVSVQPEGVPSAQAVYFDIIDGRWEPDYNIFHNRVGVRKGTLYLDTQPWGYWPTEILLASSASVGWMGQLAVNGASVIGDVPPLAHVCIAPTVASSFVGTWLTDMAAISFAGRPSFAPLIPAASFIANATTGPSPIFSASLSGDQFAPASQNLYFGIPTFDVPGAAWKLWAYAPIGTAIEPAYRGRFRVFSFMRCTASVLAQVLVDVVAGPASYLPALAFANQMATVSGYDAAGNAAPSPGYSMFDMGEMTLPAIGSGIANSGAFRFWVHLLTPTATSAISLGGLYLLPVDGAAGILTHGLAVPSVGGVYAPPTQAALEINANFVDSILLTTKFPPSAPLSGQPLADGRTYYRGVSPRLGASTVSMTFLTGDRAAGLVGSIGAGPTYFTAQANLEFSQVSVSYRPTFQFLAGL